MAAVPAGRPSSLRATIWSLASRSVDARRSFCDVTDVSDASVLAEPFL